MPSVDWQWVDRDRVTVKKRWHPSGPSRQAIHYSDNGRLMKSTKSSIPFHVIWMYPTLNKRDEFLVIDTMWEHGFEDCVWDQSRKKCLWERWSGRTFRRRFLPMELDVSHTHPIPVIISCHKWNHIRKQFVCPSITTIIVNNQPQRQRWRRLGSKHASSFKGSSANDYVHSLRYVSQIPTMRIVDDVVHWRLTYGYTSLRN